MEGRTPRPSPRAARYAEDDYAGQTLLSVFAETLTILAIKQIAHRLSAGGVSLLVGLQHVRIVLRLRIGFLFAARRTAVGEARLARLEFKFLSADDAGFDGKWRHTHVYFIASRKTSNVSRNETARIKYQSRPQIWESG